MGDVYPACALDGTASPSRSRHHESGRGLTGELIFIGTEAFLAGDPAHGSRLMAGMLDVTRNWNAVAPSGMMRRACSSVRSRSPLSGTNGPRAWSWGAPPSPDSAPAAARASAASMGRRR